MTRRLLLATSSGSFVSPVDFGAECDMNEVDDAAVSGGSLSTVTSATAAFTSGDTGKTFTLASTAGAVTTGTLTYVSSTSCTMSTAAGGAMTGARFIWGTDDAAAWQDALDAALPGQTVDVVNPDYRSLVGAGLNVPDTVTLGAFGRGPFDPLTNPCGTTWGPTIGFIADSDPFITLNIGSGLGDLILYCINQVPPTASAPTTFGPIVEPAHSSIPGCKIGRPYMPNAYIGISLIGGRHMVDAPQIGALHDGVILDHSQDTIAIHRIQCHPYWRLCEGQTWTPTASTLDAYALNNARALKIHRSDSFWVDQVFCLGLYGAVLGIDSPDTGQSPDNGYGQIGMVDADGVAVGIEAFETNTPGFLVHSAIIGANGSGVGTAGQAALATTTGGSIAPKIVVKSWSHRGTWNVAATVTGAGTTLIFPGTNPG